MDVYRVFIVDDHPIVRHGLLQLFEYEADFHVCGQAANVAEALEQIEEAAPDLVLSDLTLPGRNGLELTKQLATLYPDLPVLIISMHDEALYAERALAAGARGYVMKHHSRQHVVEAARTVLAGSIHISDDLRKQKRDGGDAASILDLLTDRELEVFLLLGQGFSPRHIAERLYLSVSTIEVYRQRLKEKLGLDSSALLTRYAVRWAKDQDIP